MSGDRRLVVLAVLLSYFPAGQEAQQQESRTKKLLNVFNIVTFPNDACNSTTSNVFGVCYTASECLAKGGRKTGLS